MSSMPVSEGGGAREFKGGSGGGAGGGAGATKLIGMSATAGGRGKPKSGKQKRGDTRSARVKLRNRIEKQKQKGDPYKFNHLCALMVSQVGCPICS